MVTEVQIALQPTAGQDPAAALTAAAAKLARQSLEMLVQQAGQPLSGKIVPPPPNLPAGMAQIAVADMVLTLKLSSPLPPGTPVRIDVQPSATGQPTVVVQTAPAQPQAPAQSAPRPQNPPSPQMPNSPATTVRLTSGETVQVAPQPQVTPPPAPTQQAAIVQTAMQAQTAAPAVVTAPQPRQTSSSPSQPTPSSPTAPAPVTTQTAAPQPAPVPAGPVPAPAQQPALTTAAPPQPMATTTPSPQPTVQAATPAAPQAAVTPAQAALPASPAPVAGQQPPVPPVNPQPQPQSQTAVQPQPQPQAPVAAQTAAPSTPPPAAAPTASTTPAPATPPAPTLPATPQPQLLLQRLTQAFAQPAAPPPAAPPAPGTPAQMVMAATTQAAAQQQSAAPLLQTLAAAMPQLPAPVAEAAARVLQTRVNLDRGAPSGEGLKAAVLKSGVFLDAPAKATQPDIRQALGQLRGSLMAWLGDDIAPVAAIARRPAPPPPARGIAPRGQAPELPQQLPADAREAGKALLQQTEGALARVKLMQLSTQPADAARPGAAPASLAEWNLELPMMLGHELAMAQIQIARDGKARQDAKDKAWRLRFALKFSVLGEVGAQVSMVGRRTSVAIWADADATAEALEEMLPELAPALAAKGLDLISLTVRRGPPKDEAVPAGRLMDSFS